MRHWRPSSGKVVRVDWARAEAYGGGRRGGWRRGGGVVNGGFKRGGRKGRMGLGPWLAAAVAAGLAIGAYGVPPAALPSVESLIASAGEAIRSPGLPRTSGARNDGAWGARGGSGQVFGFCHVGGGTNCVVDGDTFYIGGDKVRIAGIDAPETHDYRCESERALGDEATQKLRALLNSGAVTMTAIDRDRDRYGRLLRNVSVDGEDVGEALISAGVAREYGSGRRGWC